MCSMMFGSLLYRHISTASKPLPSPQILTGLLALASVCFFVPGYFRDERITLWCFCVFELCCGVYYPVMGSLKGKLIEDGSRASVYAILRIPLNVFVVLALSTTKEGELQFCLFGNNIRLTRLRGDTPRHGLHHLRYAPSSCRYSGQQDPDVRRAILITRMKILRCF